MLLLLKRISVSWDKLLHAFGQNRHLGTVAITKNTSHQQIHDNSQTPKVLFLYLHMNAETVGKEQDFSLISVLWSECCPCSDDWSRLSGFVVACMKKLEWRAKEVDTLEVQSQNAPAIIWWECSFIKGAICKNISFKTLTNPQHSVTFCQMSLHCIEEISISQQSKAPKSVNTNTPASCSAKYTNMLTVVTMHRIWSVDTPWYATRFLGMISRWPIFT